MKRWMMKDLKGVDDGCVQYDSLLDALIIEYKRLT